MMEIWRPIPDEEYEVSNMGRVRSPSGKILTPRKNTGGYLRVSLTGARDRYIHRLVCLAFYGPPPSGNHADHINSRRDDNRLCNLRWLSPEENRALRKFRRGEGHASAKLTDQVVRGIRDGTIEGNNHHIARMLGVSRETIRDARNGKIWRHVQ